MNRFICQVLTVLSVIFFISSVLCLFLTFTADNTILPMWAYFLSGCITSLFFGCIAWVARVVFISVLPDEAFYSESAED